MLEFFARCSPDWPMADAFPGRCNCFWHRRVGVLDEVYEMWRDLGITNGDVRVGSKKDSGPCTYASTFNTLVGTWKTQRSTRSSGSYGGSRSDPITIDLLGNAHGKMAVQVERGLIGNHVQACKERWILTAGRATKRHDALPADFRLPPGVESRWTWLPLSSRLAQSFGWD
eukprot:5412640-Karenia_brevis.AAC.1